MLRQRLVRQGAVNISSGSESSGMPSPQPTRRRRASKDSNLYKQISSDSLNDLINFSETNGPPKRNDRRHSVACGVMYVDIQKPSLKAAFNSAVRRMSGACSLLSSAPSSTYNLAYQQPEPKKKEEEVLLPHVLGTFCQNQHLIPQKPNNNRNQAKNHFQVNRRFSTDCPPPSYSEATNLWKQPMPRQKLLTRQHEVRSPKGSLVAVEDDDTSNVDE